MGEGVDFGSENKAAVGRDVTGRDRNQPQQNVTLGGSGNNSEYLQLWMKVLELAQQIRELSFHMDNLPDRVRRLEGLEVVIKPGPEVVIRPTPESVNISMRVLVTILLVLGLFVASAVGYLVYLQVMRA